MNTARQSKQTILLGSLFALFIFSLATIYSLLVLYLKNNLHVNSDNYYATFATFNFLLFTFPIIGGYFVDQLGAKNAAILGISLGFIGSLFIASHGLNKLHTGLAVYIAGYGLASTAFYCLMDLSFEKHAKNRESHFVLFYLIFNIGALIASFLGGYIARDINYASPFKLSSLLLFILLAIFLLVSRQIHTAKQRIKPPQPSQMLTKKTGTQLIIMGILIVCMRWLISHDTDNQYVIFTLLIGVICYSLRLIRKTKNISEKNNLIMLFILFSIAMAFWIPYALEPSFLTIFIDQHVDKHIFGLNLPSSSFYGILSFYIIIFGLISSFLWRYLANKQCNPSVINKFLLGIIAMAIGFGILSLSIQFSNAQHLVNAWWILSAYMFLTLSELLVSAIGLSMIGRLTPASKEGMLTGIWQFIIGFSMFISQYIAKQTSLPQHSTPGKQLYGAIFIKISIVCLFISIVIALLKPKLKNLNSDP